MSKFAYQLTFNASSTALTPVQIHAFMTKNRDVTHWYVPFPGCYIFKSDQTLIELQPSFIHFFGQSMFILSFLSPPLVTGVLPPLIWEWLQRPDAPLLSQNS